MKFLFCILPVVFLACTNTLKSVEKKEIPVNEDFYGYYDGSSNTASNVTTSIYQLKLVAGSDDVDLLLLNAVQGFIIDKSFLSSQIFPEGSLFRKRINSFSLENSSKPENIINAQLLKDDKYSSYKLLIAKPNPKKKEELFRQWLFPDNLSQEQLAIRISRTIVKYSFQEL